MSRSGATSGDRPSGRLTGAARARAGGRVLDLRYERLSKAWALQQEVG